MKGGRNLSLLSQLISQWYLIGINFPHFAWVELRQICDIDV